MIEVSALTDSEGVRKGFRVSGHSGYRSAGQDIVCSAVSVLAVNTVNSIEAFTKDTFESLAVNEEEGFFFAELKEVSDASRLLLDSFFLGIEGICESYGKYVKIR
ncbi:MAG: ribosomal-processing cysteine protease Prp [Lachnospiraceae bacterium]|nr:ribosomal-processing cysteine protease Prp [Lachnospiraceae bacterium]MBP5255050.1 ribosomal-processing cysteine protease Prp [Lachnospiraceae bacterium]